MFVPTVGHVRLLHTSDWHLGRSFHRVGMLSAQAAFVDHLVEVVRSERVDAVLVAGDVYDRALPGVDVVALLDDALSRLAGTGASIILSSGNHDSPRRLGFGSRLLEQAGVHVRTDPARCGEPVLLTDRHGTVAVYPVPYLEPALVAGLLPRSNPRPHPQPQAQVEVEGEGPGHMSGSAEPGAARSGGADRSHAAVLSAAMAAVRADLGHRPAGTRSVVAAHAFVVGGAPSDSERDITVGGVASVPAAVFDGVDYVALGHLHGRQRLAETVRYSGSPLAYSFSEHRHVKGSWLVELGASGVEAVEPVDAPVPRALAVLRGDLDELLRDPALAPHEASWCQVTLTDPQRPPDAMTRLRERFPHAVELRFEPRGVAASSSYSARVSGLDDLDVCCGFVEHVRGRRPSEPEQALLAEAVEGARVALSREHGVAPLRAGRRLAPPSPAAASGGQARDGDLEVAG